MICAIVRVHPIPGSHFGVQAFFAGFGGLIVVGATESMGWFLLFCLLRLCAPVGTQLRFLPEILRHKSHQLRGSFHYRRWYIKPPLAVYENPTPCRDALVLGILHSHSVEAFLGASHLRAVGAIKGVGF